MDRINKFNKKFFQTFILLILNCFYINSFAVNLVNMKINALANENIEIELMFDGNLPKFERYYFPEIPIIAFDFIGSASNIKRYHDVNLNNVVSIEVVDNQEKTRVSIGLKKATNYSYNPKDNSITVLIGENYKADTNKNIETTTQTLDTAKAESEAKAEVKAEVKAKFRGIAKIDFKINELGEGVVILDLSEDNIPIDIHSADGKIYIKMDGELIPSELRNRYDVNDFYTPVSFIDANVENNKTTIIIDTKEPFDYFAFQTNSQFNVNIRKKDERHIYYSNEDQVYSGEKINLNFQDIEIRSILQLIASFSSFNLVASDSIKGSMTLHLDQVPWEQALDIVMKSKGLDKRIRDNIMLIAPIDELVRREKTVLENAKQLSNLEPITTQVIRIKYSEAEEIAAMLSGKQDKNSALLSKEGSVQVVPRTNSLLIKDNSSKISELRKLIDRIDTPNKQVMIETRIVAINNNFKKDLGFKWNLKPSAIDIGSNRSINISGASTKNSEDGGVEDAAGETGLFTDLSVAGPGLSFGIKGGGGSLLGLQINAALSDGGGENLSQPRIITEDKTEAIIKSGTQVPYESQTKEGGTTVSFKDAVLSLKVKPHITPDNKIILDLKINNDSIGDKNRESAPSINTDEITTRVSINDGETLALGGVFKHFKSSNISKVPWLSSIPIIGALFKRTVKGDQKNEILVFITPTIVKDRLPLMIPND